MMHSYRSTCRTDLKTLGMKNRYLKNARIPEKKVRELLNLFCEDLTATQIANVSGISRITVNAYLKLIRTQIAQYCEEHNPYGHYFRQFSFLPKRSLTDVEVEHIAENQFYGLFRSEQSIYTKQILNIDNNWLNNWVRGKTIVERSVLEANGLHIYEAVVDFGRTKLHRVNLPPAAIKGKSKIDEIDLFWGLLKSRIVKFRGLNTGTVYLHVKESEFRYNHRHGDLFNIVHALIQKRPLHFARQETLMP